MGSEKHVQYTLGAATIEDTLYAIVLFVRDSGQTTVRFVNDAGTDAIWNGTAFRNASQITSAASFPAATASYVVIEPVSAMPGGERWQIKIHNETPSADDVSCIVACTKAGSTQGWTNAGAGWHANCIKTAAAMWNGGLNPTATMKILISASDLNTYDQHQFDGQAQAIVAYTYFRVLAYDSAGTEDTTKFPYGVRVGGYRPMEPHADLNPWAVLIRRPSIYGASLTWGVNLSDANQLSRAPTEDAQTTLDLTSTGYARIIGCLFAAGNPSLTRSNKWATTMLYLVGITGSDVLGSFGKYDMMAGNLDRSDATVDSAAEYMCVNDLVIRWKP